MAITRSSLFLLTTWANYLNPTNLGSLLYIPIPPVGVPYWRWAYPANQSWHWW